MKSKVCFKVFSVLVILCMLVSVSCINVNAASSVITDGTKFKREITPKTVKVNEKQSIKFKYEGDLELPYNIVPEKEIVLLIDTSGSLYKYPPQAVYFPDYCLFSGNETPTTNLEFRGNDIVIEGKVHSNSGIVIAGNNTDFSFVDEDGNRITEGIVEYVSNKLVEQTDNQKKKEAEGYLVQSEIAPLPDINSKINEYVSNQLNGKVYIFDASRDDFQETIDAYKQELKSKGYLNNLDDITITVEGTGSNGATNYKVGGSATFNILPNVKLDFRGNVQFINSVKFNEYGIVVAVNDIVIQGAGVSTGIDPVTNKVNEAFFYSLSGNILNDIAGTQFTGTYYAPEGNIRLNGNDIDIIGSVISKDIIAQPMTTSIKYDRDSEANKMFKTILPKPTLYDNVYNAAKGYLDKLADDILAKNFKAPVRVGILTYDSTANSSNYSNSLFYSGLIDINRPVDGVFSEVNMFKNVIENIRVSANVIFSKNNPVDERVGKSNLGDGLRGANSVFSTDPNVLRTVIVFSGSNPNTWSVNSKNGQMYFGNDDIGGSSSKYKYEDDIDVPGKIINSDSYKYALEMGKILAARGIVPKFINCMQNDAANKDAHDMTDFAFKKLEDGILKYDGKAFSEDIDKLYYDAEGDLNKIIGAVNEITDEIYTNNVNLVGTLTLKFTLPNEAKYTPTGGVVADTNIDNAYSYVKDNYQLTYDKTTGKYKLQKVELDLEVKNVLKQKVTLVNGKATVDVNYPANDNNKAVLTFEYYAEDGSLTPISIETPLEEDMIQLLYQVDIN